MNPARLESWLREHCRRERIDAVSTREIQRCGPGALRDRAKRDAAVAELVELDRVRLVEEGRRKLVRLHPALLAGAAS